jgi:tRNA dimethylallyltransferase
MTKSDTALTEDLLFSKFHRGSLSVISNELSEKVLILTGPTASGKTALAIAIAEKYDGEIVSADSMQIYKGLDITTAKPTRGELEAIPHHLIGIVDPTTSFSVADYIPLAKVAIADIISRGKTPIMTGGTGLYIKSLRDGIDFSKEGADSYIRERLQSELETQGNKALWERLEALDPVSAEKIHPQNTVRVIRALEIIETTGKKFSDYRKDAAKGSSDYDFIGCYLNFENRDTLYSRINKRVDEMVENGMIAECKKALESGEYSDTTVSQAIGYKELIPYFNGETDLNTALEQIKQSTRRYAKRQLTWFRHDYKLTPIPVPDECNFDEIFIKINDFFIKFKR